MMPWSLICANSSGGVFSKMLTIPSTIICTGRSKATFISLEVISTALGNPVPVCLPRTMARSSPDRGSTVPTSIFKSSAVNGPMRSFFFRFI